MKPYYSRDGVTIYHGDCRDLAMHLGHFTVAFADPPYGVAKAEWDRAPVPLPPLYADTIAVTPGVSNLGGMPSELYGLAYRWTLAAFITNGRTRGAFGFGNWIPCLIYSRVQTLCVLAQDAKPFAINGLMPQHPSPKPIDVVRWFLGLLPDGPVLDPFMGSGTTLIAARDLGRKAIGIEIEERYCEIAAKRLAQQVFPMEGAK